MAGLEKSVLATSLRCIMVENRVDRGLIHRDRPRLIRKSFDKGVPCPVGGERGGLSLLLGVRCRRIGTSKLLAETRADKLLLPYYLSRLTAVPWWQQWSLVK